MSQGYSYDGYGNRIVTGPIENAYATPTALSQYQNNRWYGSGADYDSAGNQKALSLPSPKRQTTVRKVY